jgi:hypothetical protein
MITKVSFQHRSWDDLINDDFLNQRLVWCREHFGPEQRYDWQDPDPWSYKQDYNGIVFLFKDSKKASVFALRWS